MTGTNSPISEIIWSESDDVYKPIVKSVRQFTKDRNVRYQNGKAYIQEKALYDLVKHLESNLRVEQGGILFGNAYTDPSNGEIYVEVTAAVAASDTVGSGSHLEFTSDSWLGIVEIARREHPEANIVGWYHSHPNIGVFMSGTDMRTQKAFFNHPWCLSIVCDPVREDIGYFLGERAVPVNPVIFRDSEKIPVENQEKKLGDKQSLPLIIDPALLSIAAGLTILAIIILYKVISPLS